MTRYARDSRKRSLEATPWKKLKQTKSFDVINGKKFNTKSIERKQRRDQNLTPTNKDNTTKQNIGHPEGDLQPSLVEVLAVVDQKKTINKKSSTNEEDSTDPTNFKALVAKTTWRGEIRRVKRASNRALTMVCYHCRNPGHAMAECPQLNEDNEQGTGLCFKCGSTEHKSNRCPRQLKSGESSFQYAKCFICQKIGHLSKQCLENSRGLYPNGGFCLICGSVEHYKKECPENQLMKNQSSSKLITITSSRNIKDLGSADAEPELLVKIPSKIKKGPKIIKF